MILPPGFDAIIALGTGRVVDMAKALNMAVTLGPDTLKPTREPFSPAKPLAPFVYIPTGVGTGMEAGTTARFNGNLFDSPFLVPDLAVIDPVILTQGTKDSIINSGLTCLAACCEAHVLSKNPPARAYAATAIALVMENFMPLVRNILMPDALPDRVSDKKTAGHNLASLTHASVITGIILANYKGLSTFQFAIHLADHCSASTGQAMAIIVPAVLDILSKDRSDIGNLALPLSGPDEFGTIPRTLCDAGLKRETISSLARTMTSQPWPTGAGPMGINPDQAEAILVSAFEGQVSRQTNQVQAQDLTHLTQD